MGGFILYFVVAKAHPYGIVVIVYVYVTLFVLYVMHRGRIARAEHIRNPWPQFVQDILCGGNLLFVGGEIAFVNPIYYGFAYIQRLCFGRNADSGWPLVLTRQPLMSVKLFEDLFSVSSSTVLFVFIMAAAILRAS